MSRKENLDNEEFRIVSMDQEVIKGDANKLKLLITSYAAIMEVQDAYMQEEIKAKEDKTIKLETQIKNDNITDDGVKEYASLVKQIRGLKEVYNKFSESRTRFMDLAKKALRLPNENFKQLADKGYTKISGETIDLSSLASSYEKTQKTLANDENVDVFSNIDNETIREEIERTINEYSQLNAEGDKKNTVKDYIVNNKTDKEKVDEFAEEVSLMADYVKDNIEKGQEEDLQEAARIIFEDSIDGKEKDNEDQTKKKSDTSSPVNFEADTSMSEYLSKLEKETQEIKASRERTEGEKEKALQGKTAAEKARDEAKKKSEKTKREVEMFKQYMPAIKEAQEAKRKEQEALEASMAELASINSETTALETETVAYDEETSKSLEELRRLREEFDETKTVGDDVGQYGGTGGRTK